MPIKTLNTMTPNQPPTIPCTLVTSDQILLEPPALINLVIFILIIYYNMLLIYIFPLAPWAAK